MIENVLPDHAQLKYVAFRQLEVLVDGEVEGGVPRTIEDAAAERADRAGGRHGECLSGEGRRAIRSHRAAVGADRRGRYEVRSGAGHAELEDPAQLIHGQRRVHRVALVGLHVGLPVEGAAARVDAEVLAAIGG